MEQLYSDTQMSTDTLIRVFNDSLNPIELKWHRDAEDRTISAIYDTDWMIQIEDQLPGVIINEIKIKSGVWHRLIKGTGDLILKIIKENGK